MSRPCTVLGVVMICSTGTDKPSPCSFCCSAWRNGNSPAGVPSPAMRSDGARTTLRMAWRIASPLSQSSGRCPPPGRSSPLAVAKGRRNTLSRSWGNRSTQVTEAGRGQSIATK